MKGKANEGRNDVSITTCGDCCMSRFLMGTSSAINHVSFVKENVMRQTSYNVTLNLTASEQKLLNQIWRENQGTLPTLESAVYKLALDGVRIQLEAKKEENRIKFRKRRDGKAAKTTS